MVTVGAGVCLLLVACWRPIESPIPPQALDGALVIILVEQLRDGSLRARSAPPASRLAWTEDLEAVEREALFYGCEDVVPAGLSTDWGPPPACLPRTARRWRSSPVEMGWAAEGAPLVPLCSPCEERPLRLEAPVSVPAPAESANLIDAALLAPGVVLVSGYLEGEPPRWHVVERSGVSRRLLFEGDDPGRVPLGGWISGSTPGHGWALGDRLYEVELSPADRPERARLTAQSATVSFFPPRSMVVGVRAPWGEPTFLGPDGSVWTVRAGELRSLHPGQRWEPRAHQLLPELLTLPDGRLLAVATASVAPRRIGEYGVITKGAVQVERVRDGRHVETLALDGQQVLTVLLDEGAGTLGRLVPGGSFTALTPVPRNTHRLAILKGQVILTTRDNTLQRILVDPLLTCPLVPLPATRKILSDGDALALASSDALGVSWASLAPPSRCGLPVP